MEFLFMGNNKTHLFPMVLCLLIGMTEMQLCQNQHGTTVSRHSAISNEPGRSEGKLFIQWKMLRDFIQEGTRYTYTHTSAGDVRTTGQQDSGFYETCLHFSLVQTVIQLVPDYKLVFSVIASREQCGYILYVHINKIYLEYSFISLLLPTRK